MKIPTIVLLGVSVALATAAHAQDHDDWSRSQIRHVLSISVGGMHAVDYLNCSHGIARFNNGAPYCPNLASLAAPALTS